MLHKKSFHLSKNEFSFRGFLVRKEVAKDCVLLKTTVFSEKDFIPLSVRKCVSNIFEKNKNKKFSVFLEINEKEFFIDFVQRIPLRSKNIKNPILKLFVFAARSWAVILKKIAFEDHLNV